MRFRQDVFGPLQSSVTGQPRCSGRDCRVGHQIVRDWGIGFNAEGPAAWLWDGLGISRGEATLCRGRKAPGGRKACSPTAPRQRGQDSPTRQDQRHGRAR